jgi:hypothetical protein
MPVLSEVDYLGIVLHSVLGPSAAKHDLDHPSRKRYSVLFFGMDLLFFFHGPRMETPRH